MVQVSIVDVGVHIVVHHIVVATVVVGVMVMVVDVVVHVAVLVRVHDLVLIVYHGVRHRGSRSGCSWCCHRRCCRCRCCCRELITDKIGGR